MENLLSFEIVDLSGINLTGKTNALAGGGCGCSGETNGSCGCPAPIEEKSKLSSSALK